MKSRLLCILFAAAMLAGGSTLAQVKPQEKPQDKPQDKKDPAADKKKADKNELPLEMTQKLEFETDEGTWMSLDVTPDGQAVIFELLGDLYKVPMSGGAASRLTDGAPYDAQPRISPDGKWIAFISDRSGSDNLWIVKTDGKDPRKLSSESQDAVISPAWTPDSQYVIASMRATGGTQLRMFHINGGSGIPLAGAAPAPAAGAPPAGGATGPNRLGASMSPDGRYLFVAQAGTGTGLSRWQIARLDMRTGDADVITQAEGGGLRPLVSPDGSLVVYATRYETKTGLRVRNLATGADRWLKWPIDRDEQESGGSPSRDTVPGYAFTPDGREIVITSGGKLERINIETGASVPVPFTAKVSLDIGPELEFSYRVPQGVVRAKLIQDPRQSPDGKRVVMSVLTHLYVMDMPGARPRRLLPDSTEHAFKPTWSPDGQWIAYVTWSAEGKGHIWKVRADGGSRPQQLTKLSGFYTDLTFSPDGQRIVALRGNEYQRQQSFSEFGGLRIPLDLVWLPSAGGDVEMIVPARGLGRPHFTTDPSRIFVYSNDGVISLRYDGTDRRTHLRVTGPGRAGAPRPPAADAVLMRPDGQWALAEVNNQLWVVAVPPFTGSPASVNVRSPALPVKRLTDIGADYFAWANDGKTITWAIGSTFFRRSFETIDFTPEPAGRGAGAAGEGGAGDKPEGAGEKPQGAAGEKPQPAKPKDPLDVDKNVERFEVGIEVPRATPKGTIVLKGATIITSRGDEVIRNGDVVVTDNRITAVGRGVKAPAGAKLIDARGKFIVPGFIDTHAHWEFRTHDVLEPQNWSLIANLAYGVTAGLDVQTSTNDYFAYQDLVETGQSIGQRAFMTGPGVFSNNDFQSYEATLAYLKRYKEHYRTPNIKSYMVGNRKQRQWVVRAARELGLMPTTEGGRDMKLDITHVIDGMHGNEHTLPVFPLYKDVVELFAKTKTAYTPTLLVNYGGIIAEEYFYATTEVHDDRKLNRFYPHNVLDDLTRRRRVWARQDEFVFPLAAAAAAKIQRAGGLVGVGGHGQLQGLGYHWEMWGLAMGGMTPAEVLKAATIDGAKIIGIEQDLGSIEAGKLADLVVLDRNPLQDIRNTNSVRYVMKNGELYEGDTLDQIWPVQKKLPTFWWWEAAPKPPVTMPNGDGGR